MKKKALFIASLAVSLLVVYLVSAENITRKPKLISPLLSPGRPSVNLWLPKTGLDTVDAQFQVTAKAAYFIEANSKEVLFQKNPHLKVPIASLNKIMTAIVALEQKDWNETFSVSERAAGMEPDKMLLQSGETLTLEELLYGLFLVSANDASEVLAEQATGNREEFISLMNSKAAQLGMRDTNLLNPTGLDEDGTQQYSSAYDVALMTRYAIRSFPRLLDITSTYHEVLPQTPTHQDYDLYSGINLLTTYPGVVGFKTGYTPKAGLTLVTVAKKDHNLIIGVLLDSPNRRDEARMLLDYSFKKLGAAI